MNQTEYFQKIGYRAVYNLGDRVRGRFTPEGSNNGIPFAGSIGNDTLKSTEEGPYLTIHPDLPVLYKGEGEESPTVYNILIVKHRDITDRYIEDKRFPPLKANKHD